MSKVTVGFAPRERFAVAHECLESVLDCTHVPFELLVIDCNTPKKYLDRMEKVTRGASNVRYLRVPEYMSQGECRNLLRESHGGDFICVTENDILVEDGWLAPLLDAAQESPLSVAVPHIMEGPEPLGPAHFDWRLHHLEDIEGDSGPMVEVMERTSWEDYEPGKFVRARWEFAENHCIMWSREALEAYGPWETRTNTREEIELSLRMREVGISIWFEPQSHVHFLTVGDFSIEPEEAEFFKNKWDLDRARWSHEYYTEKWNLVEMPTSMPFIEERLKRAP